MCKEKKNTFQNLCVSNSLLGLMKVGRTFDNHCFLHEVDDSVVTLHPLNELDKGAKDGVVCW